MYSEKDLFSLRENIGSKIERIMEEKSITKAQLCRKTGVSRPTLDKILAGFITNKTNFDKHIYKIMEGLNISEDVLLGNIKKNKTRIIREVMEKSIDEISKATGIPVTKLKEIEAGGDANISEWRDIALYLSTSVNAIQGKNFFEPQISEMNLLLRNLKDNNIKTISGFWGHIGVLAKNGKKYHWFPITKNTRENYYHDMNRESIIIPCMNNKVLYLNMENIDKIVLLDDSCDGPYDLDWSPDISEGEIPLVIYEVLEDYEYCNDDKISPKFLAVMDKIVKKYNWSEEDIVDILNNIKIHYNDGREEIDSIMFDESENISVFVSCLYDYEDYEEVEKVFFYSGYGEREVFLNRRNIAMIELPLIKLENAINAL